MIRYLIKNNFKLMFRNTWSIAVMVLGPILTIALLSSAFSELMKSYEGVDEFAVGYRMEETADMLIESAKTAGKKQGILFYEYPEGKIKDVMEKNELAGFVEFSGDKYTVYTSADYEVEGITLEYFMDKVMNAGVNSSLQLQEPSEIELSIKALEYMPAVNATDYYGIVYIIYYCWFGIICATGVLSNEKKYGIVRRFQVSGVSGIKEYFGKYIPITLIVAAGISVSAIVTVILYDIQWGSCLPLSIFIVFMMIMASTALGMMFYNISNSLVITVILQFTVVWLMGFFGGSFETYMFSSMSDLLKNLSPIYHGNRALVELSCMGESSYAVSSVLYSLALTVVCSVIAVIAGYIRKRGKA